MNPSRLLRHGFLLFSAVLALLLISVPMFADGTPPDPQIPSQQLISPEALNQLLKSQKVLIFNVGPRSMFQQAHIPGSEYIGPGSMPEGLEALRARVKSLPKNTPMILYCGCCPWSHCPNVHPAYKQLRDLGYTHVRVLYIADNFGADWVNPGYPTVRGE